jgi:hypothetical protein
MTKKQLTVLAVLALPWAIIGGWQPEPSHSATAYAVSPASAFGQQPAPAASKVTWEYRILLGYTSQLASLESSINAFAEQGYTVESFQPVSSVSGGRAEGADSYFEVKSTTQVFVLLRRIRR